MAESEKVFLPEVGLWPKVDKTGRKYLGGKVKETIVAGSYLMHYRAEKTGVGKSGKPLPASRLVVLPPQEVNPHVQQQAPVQAPAQAAARAAIVNEPPVEDDLPF